MQAFLNENPVVVSTPLSKTTSQKHRKRGIDATNTMLRFYRTIGVPWFRDKPNDRLRGSRVLGRIGLSVNSGASMSVVEVQGFWKDQLVIDC